MSTYISCSLKRKWFSGGDYPSTPPLYIYTMQPAQSCSTLKALINYHITCFFNARLFDRSMQTSLRYVPRRDYPLEKTWYSWQVLLPRRSHTNPRRNENLDWVKDSADQGIGR